MPITESEIYFSTGMRSVYSEHAHLNSIKAVSLAIARISVVTRPLQNVFINS